MIRYEPNPPARRDTSHRRITECMAETMREMAGSGLTVLAETLEERGFSAAAIRRFGGEARNIARRRSVRHVGMH